MDEASSLCITELPTGLARELEEIDARGSRRRRGLPARRAASLDVARSPERVEEEVAEILRIRAANAPAGR
jgi:hypothetical protein